MAVVIPEDFSGSVDDAARLLQDDSFHVEQSEKAPAGASKKAPKAAQTDDQDESEGPAESEGDENDSDSDDQAEDESEDEGEDEGEDDGDEEEAADDDSIEVDLGDEKLKLTKSQLKDSILRHRDYTQKTMALANDRKVLEAERVTVQSSRQAEQQALLRLADEIEALMQTDPPEKLAELRQEDPEEYIRRIEAQQSRHALSAKIAAQRSALSQKEVEERLPAEIAAIRSAIPEWETDADFQKGLGEIGRYATKAVSEGGGGVDLARWKQVTTHQEVILAYKAMKYDQLARAKTTLKSKVPAAKVTPSLKAGSTVSSKGEVAVAKKRALARKLSSSGRVQDAAAALEALDL